MVRAISLRRSRGAFQSSFIPQSRSMGRAWYLVLAVAACSAPKVPLGDPQAEIAAMLVRSAADWNRGDLGLHGRLRPGLDDELRVGGPRPVRLASAVRPLPSELLRAGAVARFPALRGDTG